MADLEESIAKELADIVREQIDAAIQPLKDRLPRLGEVVGDWRRCKGGFLQRFHTRLEAARCPSPILPARCTDMQWEGRRLSVLAQRALCGVAPMDRQARP